MDHQRRFDAVAAKRQNGNAEVIPFTGAGAHDARDRSAAADLRRPRES
jgi:hypothetical protein